MPHSFLFAFEIAASLSLLAMTDKTNARNDDLLQAQIMPYQERKNAEGCTLGIFVKLLANLLWNIVGYLIYLPILIRVRVRHLYCGGACLAQIVGSGTTPHR